MKIMCWQLPGITRQAISKCFGQGGDTLGSQIKKNLCATRWRRKNTATRSCNAHLQLGKQHCYPSWAQKKNETKSKTLLWKLNNSSVCLSVSVSPGLVEARRASMVLREYAALFLARTQLQPHGMFISLCLADPYEAGDASWPSVIKWLCLHRQVKKWTASWILHVHDISDLVKYF